MKFTFENQGTNTYLVYQIAETDELDTMSLGMLTNNEIPGLAAASFTQMDTTKYIKFNVSAKVSVAQLFDGTVNKKRLLGVFSGIVDAMIAAEEYMLDASSLLLDKDYIFTDVSTCETVMVCLPVMNSGRQAPDLGMFFKNIIFSTQFDQTENCDHVAKIINYLNSNPILSLADFKELLDSIGKANAPVAPVQPRVAAPVSAAAPAAAAVQQPAAPVVNRAPVAPAAPVAPVAPQPKVAVPVQPVAAKPVAVPKVDRINVPQAPQVPRGPQAAPQAPAAPQTQGEKPMSMFYLLQHYNKENAALYKAQKEAKKANKGAGKAAPAPVPAQPVAPKAPARPVPVAVPGKKGPAAPGFAVPGQQPAAPGFAVPGQQPAAPGFAVPGQQPKPVAPTPVPKPVMPTPVPKQPAVQPQAPAPAPVYQAPVQQSMPINFGETTVLGGGGIGETTVLGVSADPARTEPHLIRSKNNEKIPLNKPVFRIGKERSYVDYFIGDNTAISRSHANIVNHNGEFFVVDTNSTNHTYVNGGMIQSGVETPLSHGTKIRLANEDFEFKMF